MVSRGKREKQWFTSITPFNTFASGVQGSIQLFNATIHGPRFIKGATVLRTIVEMELKATAVAQLVEIFWGLVVLNSDARVAGAVPEADHTPSPLSTPGSPAPSRYATT